MRHALRGGFGAEARTYEVLIVMMFGGMAAKNNPIGRNAARAFKKSLKPSLKCKPVK